MVGPSNPPPAFLGWCPTPPWRRVPSLVPDQLPASLSLGKAPLETPGTELWLASGVIRLGRGFPTSFLAYAGFLDGNGHMASDF